MGYPFAKGHGTENDFVLLPDPDGVLHPDLTGEQVRALCDRRAGLGADGVLRVVRTEHVDEQLARGSGPEWFMDYRNADGSLSEMCGNGIRVFARFLHEEGLVPPGALEVATRSGVRTVTPRDDGFSVDLGRPRVVGETKVGVGDRSWSALHVDVGNPHAVALVEDLAEAGPLAEAPAYDASAYPDGVNVEFVVRTGPRSLAMRVFERGSGETRSCGTGACAAAKAAVHAEGVGDPSEWRIDVLGGSLVVTLDPGGRVHLAGPAVVVARGETAL